MLAENLNCCIRNDIKVEAIDSESPWIHFLRGHGNSNLDDDHGLSLVWDRTTEVVTPVSNHR